MPSKMRPGDIVLALGLMSGTSRDGIDAALVATDGALTVTLGAAMTRPYPAPFRQRLGSVIGGRGPAAEVERELTVLHAEVARGLLAKSGTPPADVRVIGFHGHTVLHAPERRLTWQIGDGSLLAELTGIEVVNDFRSRDVAEGGQGAPLAPIFHAALTRGMRRPIAVLNIGGVANVTWIGSDDSSGQERLLAFDTGPGNALLDDWSLRQTGRPCDIDGALARAGRVDQSAVAALMSHAYFDRPPPKSLDRDAFDPAPIADLSASDGAATLTAFTAATIARAVDFFPVPVQRWLVTGGGRRNPALMAALQERLGMPALPIEAVGWDGDALEAQAFAYLAVRSLRALPLSFPGTTAVPHPITGGRLHHAPGPARRL